MINKIKNVLLFLLYFLFKSMVFNFLSENFALSNINYSKPQYFIIKIVLSHICGTFQKKNWQISWKHFIYFFDIMYMKTMVIKPIWIVK